jgi:diguanylate cyclase (GGDEF)-like protein
MKKLFQKIYDYLKTDTLLFRENENEIVLRNITSLRNICPIFLGIIICYFFYMHVRMANPLLDLVYYIFIPLFVICYVLALTVDIKEQQDHANMKAIRSVIWIFVSTAMAFIIVVSIFPYVDKPAIYFSPMLICCTVAFMDKLVTSLFFSLCSYGIFNVAVTLLKNGSTLSYDRFGSFMGLIGTFIVCFLMSQMRNAEYKAKEEVEKFVSIDALSGQLNKATIERFCRENIEKNHGKGDSTLLMIDIDNFKTINDQLGHKQGDVVITRLGHLLGDFFKENGTVGRFGGDEFIVFLKNTADVSRIRDRLEGLLLSVSGIFSEYSDIVITCSIGIATNIGNQIPFSKLLYRADMALYEAKSQGKNRSCAYLENVKEEDLDKPLMLIADDAEVSRVILSNIFKNDFSIIQADNGRQALDLMQKYYRVLSIVLLDWNMPEMNGKEVLVAVRGDEHLKDIPILVITGDESNELEALQGGAVDYIMKPFDASIIRLRAHNSMRVIS